MPKMSSNYFNSYFSQVALITGIAGACRKEELTNLLLENVKDERLVFAYIQIPNTKTKIPRKYGVLSFRQNVSKNSFGCALI